MGDTIRSGSDIIILGAGGHALSVADAAESSGMAIRGLYSREPGARPGAFFEVLSDLAEVDFASVRFALGIGMNHSREDFLGSFLSDFPRARLATVIHTTAWVSPHSTVHEGAVILAQASVGPGSVVGRGALLNTGASLDHDSSLGSFGSLGPGARTGGDVRIGERTMVGMQAGILHGISVGSDTVIGAHSLVNQDVENNTVAWGAPAGVMRSRAREDAYY
jgi:sugar O-acyltransferase (sialic acid O-acetyltransferase NeuD family)